MNSEAIEMGNICLPNVNSEVAMIPFDVTTLAGIPTALIRTVKDMLAGIECKGTAFFTIHGKRLKKGETLRRGGPHTDGNYEPHQMTFGGGGWKVGQDGPGINTDLHDRQYNNKCGGIILASNYSACIGWVGEFQGLPKTGGDCSHIKLDKPFSLKPDAVYYGNNHFIHESLAVSDDVHRVFARITLPEDHIFNVKNTQSG